MGLLYFLLMHRYLYEQVYHLVRNLIPTRFHSNKSRCEPQELTLLLRSERFDKLIPSLALKIQGSQAKDEIGLHTFILFSLEELIQEGE